MRSDPRFFQSWREAGPDERAELLFTLTLLIVLFSIMAGTAAVIGWLIALVGWPKVGVGVAVGMFTFSVVRLWRL